MIAVILKKNLSVKSCNINYDPLSPRLSIYISYNRILKICIKKTGLDLGSRDEIVLGLLCQVLHCLTFQVVIQVHQENRREFKLNV